MILREARKGVQQQYGAIREALEQEEQSALQCVMKEESRVLGGLEDKLSQLQSSLQSIQQGLHTLEELADTRGDKCIQDQAFIMVSWILGEEPVCLFVKYTWVSVSKWELIKENVLSSFWHDRSTARLPNCKLNFCLLAWKAAVYQNLVVWSFVFLI